MKPTILLCYKTIAYVTGVGLIILVFAGIPLQVWAHNDLVVNVVGTIHGFLYMIYVVIALALSFQARFNPLKTGLVVLAGTVPFCAFIAEHKIAKQAEQIIATRRVNRGRPAARPPAPRGGAASESEATSSEHAARG